MIDLLLLMIPDSMSILVFITTSEIQMIIMSQYV